MNSDAARDDALLAELRTAVQRAGEPTESMVAAGEAAMSWRTIDAELALLTHDSLDEELLVRGADAMPRSLAFETEGLTVEVERTGDGLVGQLIPPGEGEVIVLTPQGERARVRADALGCFTVTGVTPGPHRLRCTTATADVVTDWVHL